MQNFAFFVAFISLTFCEATHNTSRSVSPRKGVCIAPEYYQCSDLAGLPGASWYYNWGTQPSHLSHPECDGVPQPESPEFVPMIWGWYGQQLPPLPDYDTVLGFNEPNHKDQANLSPEKAALGWMELQAAYPDKTLVSPSASPPNTEEWFDEFFEICESLGCRIDYIATHSYNNKAEWTINFVNGLYERYGKQIWLTEFAMSSTMSLEDEMTYMQEVLPWLETSPAIWRYSWFVHRWPRQGSGEGWYLDRVISLMEEDSNTLTQLGRYYNDF